MVESMTKINNHIVVLGASGMLGNAVTRYFHQGAGYSITGAVRSKDSIDLFPLDLQDKIAWGVDADHFDTVRNFIKAERPGVVINCVGLVKQLSDINDPLITLPINSLFPHKLARCCAENNARLIHMSTDCVFSGSRGHYLEEEIPDAHDLYGVSKWLGDLVKHHCQEIMGKVHGSLARAGKVTLDQMVACDEEAELCSCDLGMGYNSFCML